MYLWRFSVLHSTRASVWGFECVIPFFNRVDLFKLTYQGSFSVPVYHFHCCIHFIYPKNKTIRMPDESYLYTFEGRNVKKTRRLYTRCQHWFKRRIFPWASWLRLNIRFTNEQKRVNGTVDSYIICSLHTVDNKGCSVLFGKRDAFFNSLLLYTTPSSVCCVNFSYRN